MTSPLRLGLALTAILTLMVPAFPAKARYVCFQASETAAYGLLEGDRVIQSSGGAPKEPTPSDRSGRASPPTSISTS
jgi:hypothetical protein